jgi:hypothetical protein
MKKQKSKGLNVNHLKKIKFKENMLTPFGWGDIAWAIGLGFVLGVILF